MKRAATGRFNGIRTLAAFFVLGFLWTGGLSAVESVRIETLGGVPTIVADGKPIRSRIFFGGYRDVPLPLDDQWREYVFEFTARADSEGKGTLHLRFSHAPGEIFFDDLSTVEVDSGRELFPRQTFEKPEEFSKNWFVWPPGEKNHVGRADVVPEKGFQSSGGLRVTLQNPPSGETWPDYHLYLLPNLELVQGKKYRVSFRVYSPQKHQLSLAFYRLGKPYVFLGNRDGGDLFSSQIQMAAGAGVDMVSFPIDLPWPEPGKEPNWSAVDLACRQVLDANPNALLIPRIGLDPPGWWITAHPDEMIRWEGNPNPTRIVAAVSSALYRREASERLAALVRHLEERFGPRLAGYHPCGQNTGEWFYEDTWNNCWSGYSPADESAWRAWLLEKYESDDALKASWGDPNAERAAACAPSAERRAEAKSRLFLNPALGSPDRELLDFAEFQQKMMAETVLEFARTTREASNGKRLVLFFYGYLFEFGRPVNGPAVSGHYALDMVRRSPDIDILCSPISYFDRGTGGSAPAMTAAESVEASGKIWLFEDDTRTHLTDEKNFPGWRDGGESCEATLQLLTRNTAQCACRNFATWWMDLGMSGWFNDPRLWDRMKQFEKIDDWFLKNPTPFEPEIAAFIDERSMLLTSNNRIANPAVYEVRKELGRFGAPYGQYLLGDFLDGRSTAKLNVFLNPWLLSAETRRKLADQAGGTFAVWAFGSGLFDAERGESPDAMKELTGFEIEKIPGANEDVVLTEAGKNFGLTVPWGRESVNAPVDFRFVIKDALPDETLAVWPDGRAAVAVRKRGDSGVSLFVGVHRLSSELLRGAARKAGARLWTETDCNVSANGPFVILHASEDGPVTVDFGPNKTVRDALDGVIFGDGDEKSAEEKSLEDKASVETKSNGGMRRTFALKKGETRTLKITDEPKGAVRELAADVCVVGAGSGGCGAAIAASREGAEVVLIEKMERLGGTGTNGLVSNWEGGPGCSIAKEIFERMKAIDGAAVGRATKIDLDAPYGCRLACDEPYEISLTRAVEPKGGYRSVVYKPEAFDRVVREMLAETGRVTILDRTEFFDVEVNPEKTKIIAVWTRDSDGNILRIRADVFIDSTGSVRLCRQLGCETRRGIEPKSLYGEPLAPEKEVLRLNALTRCYRVEPVPNARPETVRPEDETDFPKCAYITGWSDGPRMINMLTTLPGADLIHDGYGRCMERSEKIVHNHWRWLQQKADFSGYELTQIAPMLGIREDDRVVTEYVLRQQDLDATWEGQTHPDMIAAADHPCDIHGEGGGLVHVKSAYGIPYRSLIPKSSYKNLLVACRGAGLSRIAAASCRLQRTILQFGHAAGVAAAWAARDDRPVREIDVERLVKKMDARARYPVKDGKLLLFPQ